MKDLIITTTSIDENILEWNAINQRWQLTMQYAKTLCDAMTYKNDSVLKQRIKKTSTRVYNYIVSHSNTVNRSVIDFLLNKTEQGQRFLIEVLTAQLEADMEYGYNEIAIIPTINTATGQVGDRDQYRLNTISIECEQIIDDSAKYFGFNICIMYPFSWSLFELARQYED